MRSVAKNNVRTQYVAVLHAAVKQKINKEH